MAMLPFQAKLIDRKPHRHRAAGGRVLSVALLAAIALTLPSACALGPTPMEPAAQATQIRDRMTTDDEHIAAVAIQIAMERRNDNEASTWTNDLSGNHGAVVPRRTYRSRSGTYCRRYDEMITVAGMTATFERTACRDGLGQWTSPT